ncbi:MAG: hypothetical protein KC731_23565, partial [Myxococcales bacterium]|nr:hypothetical protein [Myxococcales bacterium]
MARRKLSKTNKTKSPKSKGTKRCYFFSASRAEGSRSMKELLGGKGANLAEMCTIGLPVPPGFTITTETCAAYLAGGGKLPRGVMAEVDAMLARVEKEVGRAFGSGKEPLLISVRSGAAISMPGMMDTI